MNIVHLIDCMEFMKGLPDKYYELAIKGDAIIADAHCAKPFPKQGVK